MIAVALVLAVLAALLHVYIFVMESVTWTSPKTRATFWISAEQAEQTKELAFNQASTACFWPSSPPWESSWWPAGIGWPARRWCSPAPDRWPLACEFVTLPHLTPPPAPKPTPTHGRFADPDADGCPVR